MIMDFLASEWWVISSISRFLCWECCNSSLDGQKSWVYSKDERKVVSLLYYLNQDYCLWDYAVVKCSLPSLCYTFFCCIVPIEILSLSCTEGSVTGTCQKSQHKFHPGDNNNNPVIMINPSILKKKRIGHYRYWSYLFFSSS